MSNESLPPARPSFVLRAVFPEGHVEVTPTAVRPFGVSELLLHEREPSAALDIEIRGANASISGEAMGGVATLKAKIAFHKEASVFALVPGGWVPMPFAMPPRFLVDRNIVSHLKNIREGRAGAGEEALRWWAAFFEQGAAMFNPLPYAFEGNERRKPTRDEFDAAYRAGVQELRSAFPACAVVEYGESQYAAAYGQLEAFDKRYDAELDFLLEAIPLILNRPAAGRERKVADKILGIVDKHNLHRGSLVSLAVLSCIFEDLHGEPVSVGRRVLKPKTVYKVENAFNAISDLRHLELAAAGQGYFQSGAFSLCTCDRGLAAFWSALGIVAKDEAGDMTFTISLTNDLLQRVPEAELPSVRNQIFGTS